MLNERVLLVFVVTVFSGQLVWSDTAVDYCSKELCKFPWTKGEPKHIACESPEGFGPKCGTNAALATVSADLKAALVQKVNDYRNKVAAGGDVIAGGGWKFQPAVRMAYMDWDDELAHVAALASKTCTHMNDDTCFNTNNFKSTAAASHIIGTTVSPNGVNATQHILSAIDNFYKQHGNLWLEKVDQYPKAAEARDFREFALLIADHNTKFGCGCTYADSTPGWINFYVTCIFSTKNVDPSPVYKTGETSASECTKKHEMFSNLCDASEDIDPNFGFKGLQKAWEAEEAKWHTPDSLKEYLNGISSKKHLCDNELCGPSLQYDDLQPSRCNITLELGPACIKPRVYKMPTESKLKILDAFNAIRNETAGGELIGADGVKLPKAKKMPYLQWDDELAELAMLPLLDCPKRIPNICGNTYKYGATDSVQSYWPSNSKYEPDKIMTNVYPVWWKGTRKTIKPEYVEKYPNTHTSFPFRYLALIIADHATKVGCAYLVNREKLDVNGYYFHCIFSTQKVEGLPIYNVSDQSASGCEKTHPKYTNLCDESEPINPNHMSNIIKRRLQEQRYDTKAGIEFIKSINKSENYCDKKLCRGSSNPHHVACAKFLTFGTKCSKNVQLLKFTPEFKQRIVDRHNYYRNITAGGGSVGDNGVLLPKAVRMGFMQWDDELANVAAMNAKDCDFEHDSCRNTKKFTLAGQNLFLASGTAYPDSRLVEGVDSWYSEVNFTSVEQIAKYPVVSPPPDRVIGHFTAMINEKSIRVGCAMSLYAQKGENNHYLVCNYAFTNMQAHRVYKSGDVAASECTKTHEKYINLCHPDEDIDPNNLYDIAPSLKPFAQKKPNLGLLLPKKKKNDTAIHDILKPIVERDYCDPLLCRPGVVHIGCNKTAQMGPNCGEDKRIVLMTPANIELIVDLHNSLRNKTAGGHVRGAESSFLPKAVRMAYMQWDQELADLALLNLQNCESAHDQCHNTKKFFMSGQNLFGASESPPSTSNTEFLKIGVNGWFQEHEYVLPKVLATFTSESVPPGLNIGHFTVMVNEKATRVGCAAVSHFSDKFTHFKLSCNYAVTNLLNTPVYRAGNTSGSECKALHPVYTNLCDASEDINPNEGLSPLGEKPKPPSFNFEELMNKTGLPFGGPSAPGTLNLSAIPGQSMKDILSALNDSQPMTIVFPGSMSVEDMMKIFTQQEGDRDGSTPSASNDTTHPIFKVLDLDRSKLEGRFGEIDSNTIEEAITKGVPTSSFTPTATVSPNAIDELESTQWEPTTTLVSIDEPKTTTVSTPVDEPVATTVPTPDDEPKVTAASVDEPELTTVEPEVIATVSPVDEAKAPTATDDQKVTAANVDEPELTTIQPEVIATVSPVDEAKIPTDTEEASVSVDKPQVTTLPTPVEEPKASITPTDEAKTVVDAEDKPVNEPEPTTPPATANETKPTTNTSSATTDPPLVIPEGKSPDVNTLLHTNAFPMQPNGTVVFRETRVFSTPNMDPFGQPGGMFGSGFPTISDRGTFETHVVQGETVVKNTVTGGVISHNQVPTDWRTGPPSSGSKIFSRGGFRMPGFEHFEVRQIPAPAQEITHPSPDGNSIFRRIGFGMPGFEHIAVPHNTPHSNNNAFSEGFRIHTLQHFGVQQSPNLTHADSMPPLEQVKQRTVITHEDITPILEHFDVQKNPVLTQEDTFRPLEHVYVQQNPVLTQEDTFRPLEHFDVQSIPLPTQEVQVPTFQYFDVRAAPPQEDTFTPLEHFDVQSSPVPTQEVKIPTFEYFDVRAAPPQEDVRPPSNTQQIFSRGGFGMPGFEKVVIRHGGGNFNPFLGQQPPQMQTSQVIIQRSIGSQTGNSFGGMFGHAIRSPSGGWLQNSPMTYPATSQNIQT